MSRLSLIVLAIGVIGCSNGSVFEYRIIEETENGFNVCAIKQAKEESSAE